MAYTVELRGGPYCGEKIEIDTTKGVIRYKGHVYEQDRNTRDGRPMYTHLHNEKGVGGMRGKDKPT